MHRHFDLVHKATRRVYVCRPPASDLSFLDKCKACRSCKRYNADYNAAEHLRRVHLKPERGPEGVKLRGRARFSFRDRTPVGELRKYMIVFEVDREGKTVSEPRKAVAESDVIVPELSELDGGTSEKKCPGKRR